MYRIKPQIFYKERTNILNDVIKGFFMLKATPNQGFNYFKALYLVGSFGLLSRVCQRVLGGEAYTRGIGIFYGCSGLGTDAYAYLLCHRMSAIINCSYRRRELGWVLVDVSSCPMFLSIFCFVYWDLENTYR